MSTSPRPDLSQRIAGFSYRVLRWGRDSLPPGIRSVLGLLFMVGGVFGFLPILGFWMLPLGAALVALDLPFMRKRIEHWMEALQKKASQGGAE
jgi:hypothetical protein